DGPQPGWVQQPGIRPPVRRARERAEPLAVRVPLRRLRALDRAGAAVRRRLLRDLLEPDRVQGGDPGANAGLVRRPGGNLEHQRMGVGLERASNVILRAPARRIRAPTWDGSFASLRMTNTKP